MARDKSGHWRNNLEHEIRRADANATAIMTAAVASLPMIEAAIKCDERGRTIDPDDTSRAAWRHQAMQALESLTAALVAHPDDDLVGKDL